MTDRLLGVLAFAMLVAFLAILVWWVPHPDLVGVVLVTLALVVYDLFLSGGGRHRG